MQFYYTYNFVNSIKELAIIILKSNFNPNINPLVNLDFKKFPNYNISNYTTKMAPRKNKIKLAELVFKILNYGI